MDYADKLPPSPWYIFAPPPRYIFPPPLTYSYGANTIRDGVSLTPRRELRALALPSEIMRLENLHGYLKFPGPFPVASIRLKYVARGAAAARFVAREGDGQDAGGDPDASGNKASADFPEHPGAADAASPVADIAPMQGELDLAVPVQEQGNAPETGNDLLPPEPGWLESEVEAGPVEPAADPEPAAAADREETPAATCAPSAPAGGGAPDWL